MALFSNYNETEKELLEIHSHMLSVLGYPDARKTAKNLLDSAIEGCKKDGTYNLPTNLGDMFFEKAKTDEKTRKMLERKRKEGVKDEDIRQWWNASEVGKKMMLEFDLFHRATLYIKERKAGKIKE